MTCRVVVVAFAVVALVGCKKADTGADGGGSGGGRPSTPSPRPAAWNVSGRLAEAERDSATVHGRAIETACKLYRAKYGEFPADLGTLVSPPPDPDGSTSRPVLNGGPKALLDPWGKPFQMQIVQTAHGGERVHVFTTAPDGTVVQNFDPSKP